MCCTVWCSVFWYSMYTIVDRLWYNNWSLVSTFVQVLTVAMYTETTPDCSGQLPPESDHKPPAGEWSFFEGHLPVLEFPKCSTYHTHMSLGYLTHCLKLLNLTVVLNFRNKACTQLWRMRPMRSSVTQCRKLTCYGVSPRTHPTELSAHFVPRYLGFAIFNFKTYAGLGSIVFQCSHFSNEFVTYKKNNFKKHFLN